MLVAREPIAVWRSPAGASEEPVDAVFELNNPGYGPVRIVDVQSGCGCAKPRIEPTVVPPGGICKVSVAGERFTIGGKLIPIELKTDSATTPIIALQLRMVGSRKPPFLVSALGDLGFVGDIESTESREMTAVIVTNDPKPTIPDVRSDLTFLAIEPVRVDTAPYAEPGTYFHNCRFLVKFIGTPPDHSFGGSVSVIDPWDEAHVERISVSGAPNPAIRIVPSHLTLTAGGIGRFAVVTKADGSVPTFEPGAEASLFAVKAIDEGQSERFHPFEVRVADAARPIEGEHRLSIGIGGGKQASLTLVVKGGSR